MAQFITSSDTCQAAITTEVVQWPRHFLAMREEWQRLFANAPNASFPLHHDWLSTWLKIFGEKHLAGPDALRIICCRCDGVLVGALPLYLRRSLRMGDGGIHLCFISTGEAEADEVCPDYLDMLCLQNVQNRCAELAWKVILDDLRKSYDRTNLMDVSEQSPLVLWARGQTTTCNDMEIQPRGICPVAELAGGFETYLGRLSANTRQHSRQLLRMAAKEEAVLEIAQSAEEANEYFQQMVTLHQARWISAGEPGCFASNLFTQFHHKLVELWQPVGLAVLSRLRVGNDVLAVTYGFHFGAKYDFYQSGVMMDKTAPIKSPGIVSLLMLMQLLCDKNITEFDFLRGSTNYKTRLATTTRPLVEVRKVRSTWPTVAGVVANVGGWGLRRLARLVSRKRTEPSHDIDSPSLHVSLSLK